MNAIRVAIVTNNPTPYREGVYKILAALADIDLCLIYCQHREANRKWEINPSGYHTRYLNTRSIKSKNQYIHFGLNVLKHLSELDPHVVITSGYGPVMLLALYWCVIRRRPHIPFTDGTLDSESNLTFVHRFVRKKVFTRSSAFVGASKKSLELFKSYGVSEEALFQSCLCVNNEIYFPQPKQNRPFDLMFAGQLVDGKMPDFFVDVARELSLRRGRCRVLIVGSGPRSGDIHDRLKESGIEFFMPGFIQPAALPNFYQQAQLFLFPTRQDAWGVVANEAAAAGMPIITVPEAGSANELVIDGHNGYVLSADVNKWASTAQRILDNPFEWEIMSKNSLDVVKRYNSQNAATGLYSAIVYAIERRKNSDL